MLTTSLVLAVSMVVGQAEPTMPEDFQAAMQYLVGKWAVEGNINDEAFTLTMTYCWAPGKHCLILNATSDGERALRNSGTGIIGRDPSTNELVETAYLHNGVRLEHRFSHISGAVWEGTGSAQNPSGSTTNSTLRLEKTSDEYSLASKAEGWTLFMRSRRVKE
jgi:hypothetical protein